MKANVLVVDDSSAFRENVIEILSEGLNGVEVTCQGVGTARDALAIAKSNDLDLALLDQHLPDRTGTEIVAPIRERSPYAQVMIITGDSAVESAILAMQKGAFGYIIKPFKSQELLESVRRALERAQLLRERAALRAELARSESHHREVIENVPALVLALDADGLIRLWNRRLEEVTGRGRYEMLGKSGRDLLREDGSDDLAAHRLLTNTGEQKYVRWRTATIDSAHGQPMTYALGIDVTEEREMQLRAQRSQHLAAVGTLAAGLAHEVRNPLNSAFLQLQLLRRRLQPLADSEAALSIAEVIGSEIQRLDHLVTDFLAFVRPDPVELMPCDVNQVLRQVSRLLTPEAQAHSVRLELELGDSVHPVLIKPERMEQVFINLARNAIEAMTDARLVENKAPNHTLTFRTRSVEAGVQAEVEDSGPGFPEETPVFDAFFTTKDQGTGLGLSIVHWIVTQHGGTISVSSRPGHTRFSLTLPAAGR